MWCHHHGHLPSPMPMLLIIMSANKAHPQRQADTLCYLSGNSSHVTANGHRRIRDANLSKSLWWGVSYDDNN